tara:strand:+ start:7590 stop:8138 length:549 start_codon:yes stop_codon:yes gene_type:complete
MNHIYDIKPFNDVPYNNINNNYSISSYDIIKEEKCVNTNIGKICTHSYKTVYNNELPKMESPYSINMPPNDHNNNKLNLREQSLKLSCNNINKQEHIYNNNNEKDFLAILNNINDPMIPSDYDYVLDTHIKRGSKVHKKSCNIKPENYNDGKWISQYDDNGEVKHSISNKLFNMNTKKKTIA